MSLDDLIVSYIQSDLQCGGGDPAATTSGNKAFDETLEDAVFFVKVLLDLPKSSRAYYTSGGCLREDDMFHLDRDMIWRAWGDPRFYALFGRIWNREGFMKRVWARGPLFDAVY